MSTTKERSLSFPCSSCTRKVIQGVDKCIMFSFMMNDKVKVIVYCDVCEHKPIGMPSKFGCFNCKKEMSIVNEEEMTKVLNTSSQVNFINLNMTIIHLHCSTKCHDEHMKESMKMPELQIIKPDKR